MWILYDCLKLLNDDIILDIIWLMHLRLFGYRINFHNAYWWLVIIIWFICVWEVTGEMRNYLRSYEWHSVSKYHFIYLNYNLTLGHKGILSTFYSEIVLGTPTQIIPWSSQRIRSQLLITVFQTRQICSYVLNVILNSSNRNICCFNVVHLVVY